ncbi:MAG: pitrilysin family protein [Planctomycetota bacterium]|nr:pitrilysin family protein [Planctomycetota bacterium]
MRLRERLDPVCGERLYEGTTEGGLAVKVMPRGTVTRSCAQLSLDYGSVDRRFIPDGRVRPVTVPSGIAHFLEHKMFEKERGDLFNEFSRLGASANAMTGHLTTSYVFSASGDFDACLDTLLELVFEPHFTDALVEKELGIIDEEIRGYDDSAGWRGYRGVLEGLYRRHPVREDIAGTSETIRQITAKTLHLVHDAFYVPSNAVLCVAGAVDPQAVVASVDKRLGTDVDRRVRAATVTPAEPAQIKRRRRKIGMPVALPILQLGFKGPGARSGRDAFRLETAASIALEVILGETSAIHEELYAEGLIGDDLSSSVRADRSMSYALVGGQTPEPNALERRLLAAIEDGLSRDLPAEDVERVGRRILGDYVRLLDSMEGLCGHLADCHRSGLDLFSLPGAMSEMSPSRVRKYARSMLGPDRVTSVSVVPKA